jgi:hypothetical protein
VPPASTLLATKLAMSLKVIAYVLAGCTDTSATGTSKVAVLDAVYGGKLLMVLIM